MQQPKDKKQIAVHPDGHLQREGSASLYVAGRSTCEAATRRPHMPSTVWKWGLMKMHKEGRAVSFERSVRGEPSDAVGLHVQYRWGTTEQTGSQGPSDGRRRD